MSHTAKIIGLAGTFASGKDTLSHYLVEEYNYLHISTGDMLRQEALKTRGSIERPILFEVANELRHTRGAGVLVEIAIKTFEARLAKGDDYNGVVISGLRSLGEAKALKAAGGFLVFTDASIEVRYERMMSRQRDNETTLTLEAFKAQEVKELATQGNNDADFNILGIRDRADVIIPNNGDLETFLQKSRQALGL